MNEQPKVSVIIPVYNTEQFLRECLDSVVNQTLRNIEIICVDDGSTDGSLAILREYEARDERVKVLTQEHSNAGAARNLGVRYTEGEYLSFLDSDDKFYLDMLAKAVERADSTESDICIFRAEKYNQRTGTIEPMPGALQTDICPKADFFSRKTIPDTIFEICTPAPWNKLFRRDFIKNNQVVFQEIEFANDIAFSLYALAIADRISIIDNILVQYRTSNSDSLVGRRDEQPTLFYEALCELKKRLEKAGIYSEVEGSFNIIALSTCIWSLKAVKTPRSFEQLFYFLRNTAFSELGLIRSCDYYRQLKAVGLYNDLVDVMNTSAIDFSQKKGMFLREVRIKVKDNEAELIRASWSYRIGRAITWLPRKVRGGFRCYMENGFFYTMKHIAKKLRGRE